MLTTTKLARLGDALRAYYQLNVERSELVFKTVERLTCEDSGYGLNETFQTLLSLETPIFEGLKLELVVDSDTGYRIVNKNNPPLEALTEDTVKISRGALLLLGTLRFKIDWQVSLDRSLKTIKQEIAGLSGSTHLKEKEEGKEMLRVIMSYVQQVMSDDSNRCSTHHLLLRDKNQLERAIASHLSPLQVTVRNGQMVIEKRDNTKSGELS